MRGSMLVVASPVRLVHRQNKKHLLAAQAGSLYDAACRANNVMLQPVPVRGSSKMNRSYV
jgi:hypothetical protein